MCIQENDKLKILWVPFLKYTKGFKKKNDYVLAHTLYVDYVVAHTLYVVAHIAHAVLLGSPWPMIL
jgi:hypothetical protein